MIRFILLEKKRVAEVYLGAGASGLPFPIRLPAISGTRPPIYTYVYLCTLTSAAIADNTPRL
jgi:hypothetical protein